MAIVILALCILNKMEEDNLSPLLKDLPSLGTARDAEFHKRVLETYPVGTPVIQLFRDLQHEGFTIGYEVYNKRPEFWANMPAGFCGMDYMISWHADEDGKVTDINTRTMTNCF